MPKIDKKRSTIYVPEELLPAIFGTHDVNRKLITSELNVEISSLGGEITVTGDDGDVVLALKLMDELKAVASSEHVSTEDVIQILKMLKVDKNVDAASVLTDKIRVSGSKKYVAPKSLNQQDYIRKIEENDITFGVGPAGTGKTYLAVSMAVNYFINKKISKIILTRPAVEAGEALGFLPGDLMDKIDPYLRPLYDALYAMMDKNFVSGLLEREVIEIAPLAFMRGRTLNNAFVILDEAQNTTPLQMKMFLTRLGPGTKMVVTGDITQIDLPRSINSGLIEASEILKNEKNIGFVKFDETDVIRHPLVAAIIRAYNNYEKM